MDITRLLKPRYGQIIVGAIVPARLLAQTRLRFLLLGMLAGMWAPEVRGESSGPAPVPYVGLREERGYLSLVTSLPAGRGNFSAIDEQGLALRGFVYVTEDAAHQKRVRLFRLSGDKAMERAGDDDARPSTSVGFSVILSATPSPDQYTLRYRTRTLAGDDIREEEAVLGRTCCGYHLSVRCGDGQNLPVARGMLLTDLMLEYPDTYRKFEQLAAICCRPGFEVVPVSRFSPSLVAHVVDQDLLRPGVEQVATLDRLLTDLDSDQLAVRDAASDTLLAAGQTTLLWLDSVSLEQLSAEQKQRLRVVRAQLERRLPVVPFAVDTAEIRELMISPSIGWLTQLRTSSQTKVRDWAIAKLRQSATERAGDEAQAIPLTSD